MCASGSAQAAPAAPVPIEHFFKNAAFAGALLSPNAKNLAARLGRTGRRGALVVIDLTNNAAKLVASFAPADVGSFHWVNDDRLVFDATD